MEVIRHGGEAHVVRPDRVYRTGVLTSIVGYQPGADVQSVARAFTMRPMGLQGYGFGAAGVGPLQALWLKLKLRFAEFRMRNFMRVNGGNGAGDNVAPSQPVIVRDAAGQIAPQQQSQVSMVNAIANGLAPGDAMDLYATRRLFSYYRAY